MTPTCAEIHILLSLEIGGIYYFAGDLELHHDDLVSGCGLSRVGRVLVE